jgi:hypothetical protein
VLMTPSNATTPRTKMTRLNKVTVLYGGPFG